MTPAARIVDGAWLRRFHPAPAAACRLVCLPHAGGAASSFAELSGLLSPALELVAVQYPGRQERTREALIDDVGTLADRVAEALLALDGGPLALFGHSLGAAIAYEVAQRLEERRRDVAGVFLSCHGPRPAGGAEGLFRRSDEAIIEALVALGGPGTELLRDPSFAELVLPILRADLKASESYECRRERKLRAPICALVGDGDPRVAVSEMEEWRHQTDGSFALEVFAGGHFYMADDVGALAACIEARLTSVTSRRGGLPAPDA